MQFNYVISFMQLRTLFCLESGVQLCPAVKEWSFNFCLVSHSLSGAAKANIA